MFTQAVAQGGMDKVRSRMVRTNAITAPGIDFEMDIITNSHIA
jgi:hypothetical protein